MEIFAKTLSNTDINKRCVVPMKYFKMGRFPKSQGEDRVVFKVKDESAHYHTFCCSKRKVGNDPNRPKHPKPVLINGWIPFVRKKKLGVGDRVIIYEEQDETGLMLRRIKVEKRTSPSEPRLSAVTNQNLDGNKGSTTDNSDKEPDLGGSNATTSSRIDKEQIPTPHGTTERPSRNLSLELTLKQPMTEGTNSSTCPIMDRKQTPFPHNNSQDIACYRTERPSLSLSLGLTPKPTMTGGQQHAYMQVLKTIDFLGAF